MLTKCCYSRPLPGTYCQLQKQLNQECGHCCDHSLKFNFGGTFPGWEDDLFQTKSSRAEGTRASAVTATTFTVAKM